MSTDNLIYRIEEFNITLQDEGYALQDIDAAFMEYGDLIKEVVSEDPEIYYDYDELVAELQQEEDVTNGYYDFIDEEEEAEFLSNYANVRS